MVLIKSLTGDGVAGPFVGHNEGKHGKADEEQNQKEHDCKVEPEEAEDATGGAHKAGYGNQQDEDAYEDKGPLQETQAVGGVLGSEPYSCHQDGQGKEGGEEIEKGYEVVAQAHLCVCVWVWVGVGGSVFGLLLSERGKC